MQATYTSQDAIPEAVRSEYEEQDGVWVLKLEGDHPAVTTVVTDANKRIAEFRNTNVSALKERDAVKAELEGWKALGLGVDQVKALQAENETLQSKVKGSKSNEDIQAIVAAAVKPLADKLDASEKARQTAEANALTQQLDGALTQAGLKAGVNESAMPDFLSRGRAYGFALVDGAVVAMENGSPRFSAKRPGEPLTVDEWAADLQAEAPHLYKPSKGGGDRPGEPDPDVRVIPASELGANLEDVAAGKARLADS